MDTSLWEPSAAQIEASTIDRFRRSVALATALDLPDTQALHRWSAADPGAFWRAAWDRLGLIGDPGAITFEPGATMPDARFFPQGQLSFTENMLAGGTDDDRAAIIWEREDGARRSLSWRELRAEVGAAAAALRAAGVEEGDRVAAWMPNVPETVVVMLATLALGAVFTSSSADFGTAGVVDRFGQVEPKVVLAADGYLYGGKQFDCMVRLGEIVAALPTVGTVVVVGHLEQEPDIGALSDAVAYDAWLAPHRGAPVPAARFGFDQPGFVLYSSGTTGTPKCIVHRAAGVLLKHRTEHSLHCDVRSGDVVFYFTTCGWMMWNWLTSALSAGAAIVLYEGSPFHPGPEVLLDLADRHGVTLFGVSAKYIDSLRKAGVRPRDTHDLGTVRTICSTGSPLSPEGFDYVYESLKSDVHLASISGGTDLCGCFVAGDPTRPVWPGEIQAPVLGMAVDVYDDDGRPLSAGRGELVCTRPFPSMPLGFWGDSDGSRYRAAYFERFAGVWAHGDFASWTTHGGIVIHGRSDATLNSAGVRIGTAEIYRIVENFPEIAEAIAIGQEHEGDTRIVLFVRMVDGHVLTDELQARVRGELRRQGSPRHVPAVIATVTDLPRTRSGKITELAVGDVVNGRTVRNTDALANPEALAQFRDRPELAGLSGAVDSDSNPDVDPNVVPNEVPNVDAVEPTVDPTAAPVLVVHGAAVRNRQGFEAEVDRLARAVGGQRRFVPVFWGDLARPAESIESVLPYLDWLNRSREVTASVDDPAAEQELPAEAEEDPISDGEEPIPDGEEPLPDGEEDPPVRRRRRVIAQREIERMMDRVGANWRRQSAAARRRVIASIYRVVRAQYLAASAHFAGDIILYQRRHREIQSRVWETIMREAPGYGLPERPITVVAHSLGSSVAFDAAVAGSPRLHIDHLITCASTVPYFHVIGCSPDTITPHQPGTTTSLPPTIGRWTNFWLPLDPWGYLAAPAFRLADGSAPTDIEVHSGEREDKIMRHAASNYWRHPTVINTIRAAITPPTTTA